MSQLLLINPRRRRKHKVRARKRRGARRMTAKQLRYFGPRKRRASRRRAAPAFLSNPRKRRRGRSIARRSRGFGGMGVSVSGITNSIKNGAIGGAGAIAVDMAMGQVAPFLPTTMTSRFDTEGKINPTYYAAKAALAIGIGIVGQKFLPGSMKGYAAQGVAGSLTVLSYQILQSLMPTDVTMGYFNPGIVTGTGNITSMGRYLPRNGVRGIGRAGMAKYVSGTGAGSAWSNGDPGNINMRTGEGTIR